MDNGKKIHFSFQELKVWQKAVGFSETVIRLIDDIDAPRKHYRLIEQLESASASVALNIAEGKGRQTTKEFIQFLYIARGSAQEISYQCELARDLKYVTEKELVNLDERYRGLSVGILICIQSLKQRL